ncbi:hypothetical protein AC578_2941 [Pseudocercospora eumusae]|uniref:Uncharacterized protein n=1 Tax=Pseudocercospora eumusae TaxID=321146 RepID=A0A139HE73_9PEZI|nr:hypothetical protein AC578_2941 [Pseudocercospora eumusae]
MDHPPCICGAPGRPTEPEVGGGEDVRRKGRSCDDRGPDSWLGAVLKHAPILQPDLPILRRNPPSRETIHPSSNERPRRFMDKDSRRGFGAFQTGLRYDQARPNIAGRPPVRCLKSCFDLVTGETTKVEATWIKDTLQCSTDNERGERNVNIVSTL